jgi:hypothetical protein
LNLIQGFHDFHGHKVCRLTWVDLYFFLWFFKLNFFFHFFFFNIELFDNWASWFYSICFQMQLLWYHDWVKDFAYWPRWAWFEFFQPCLNYTFFLKFSPSTFYFLKIELHLFSFHFFLWSYHVLIWFIKNWSSNIFSCVFFYEIISILYPWSWNLQVKLV